MATDPNTDSLSYLGEVIALFGNEEAKYSEFHQIIADFLEKKLVFVIKILLPRTFFFSWKIL